MRVITANVNGIRAAERKGFFSWMLEQDADVVCLQETKAQLSKLDDPKFHDVKGYDLYFHDAQKPGYSGVAIYTKHKPKAVKRGLGWDCPDTEGRYIELDFGDIKVASIYLPSGSSKEERQLLKYEFMEKYERYLGEIAQSKQHFVICGDWNIVHKEIDIRNWKPNQKNSGCLPEERAWLDKVFGDIGLVDAFREVNQAPEEYTWWSNRGQAWAKNVGWRIDYQIVTPKLAKLVESAAIFKDQRFSDHAPLIMSYNYTI